MGELVVIENELVNVYESENREDVIVSGRELHEFLEVGTRYDTWFKRMVGYGFEAGIDYLETHETVRAQKRARTYEQIDHHLKLDMAKEISMIQRTKKGKLARQYFIETEKKYHEQNNQTSMSVEDFIIMQAQKIKDVRLQQEKLETKK